MLPQMKTIAYFHSPFPSKFGIPRQSGIIPEVEGYVEFVPEWRTPDAIRGLEDFDYLWLIWVFSANRNTRNTPLVRPPLLGGNTKMGVFATRSPYRPNPIGISSVRIIDIDTKIPGNPIIHVSGGDLMDGTPILDIKPYLSYTDCHPHAHCGFAEQEKWRNLQVIIPTHLQEPFTPKELSAITHILEQDPRPHYQNEDNRIYGMTFQNYDIHFRVRKDILIVENIVILQNSASTKHKIL